MADERSALTSVKEFIQVLFKRRKEAPRGAMITSIRSPTVVCMENGRKCAASRSSMDSGEFRGRHVPGSGDSTKNGNVFDFRMDKGTASSASSEDKYGHRKRRSSLSVNDTHDALPSPQLKPPSTPVPKITAPKDLLSSRYYMNHETRGIAIIINNRYFSPILTMPERKGTDEDAKALSVALRCLGFAVHQYDNLTVHDMSEAMKYFASLDHFNSDSFLTAVLTHGDEGVLYGADGKMTVDRLVLPFKGNKCLSLAGKPKIFIFQACRGDRLDRGVDLIVADDVAGNILRLPAEADFLFAFSTIPGFYSWRNTDNGSWYIQALAKMIEIHYGPNEKNDPRREGNMDFVKLLTRVNFEVAYFCKSNVPTNADLDQQKQIPSIVSMLTRDLFFPVKLPVLTEDGLMESRPEKV